MINILTVLIAALLSGLVGVIVSGYYYARTERRKMKLDTARRLFGNRYNTYGDGFVQAINEIFIVYGDSKDVLMAWREFVSVVERSSRENTPNANDEALIKLMKAISKELCMKHDDIEGGFYLKTFTNVPADAATGKELRLLIETMGNKGGDKHR